MDNFRAGDRIFLFGFSRGAYTARAVCSLLHMYGLIFPGNAPLVPYAIRMMMAIEKARLLDENQKTTSEDKKAVSDYFRLAQDFRQAMSRCECKPHFVGVWDTVNSVGWKDTPLKLPFMADNPDIQIGRHAIAIDERRAFFRTNRWMPSKELKVHGPRDAKQVWFPGVHCDVGGGYAEAESGLAKLALEWMFVEAKSAGLIVDPQREQEVLGLTPASAYVKPDPNACMHESLKGAWQLAEWIRKPHYDFKTGKTEMRRNRGHRRAIPEGSLIHDSVFLREGGKYADSIGLPKDYTRISTHPPAEAQPISIRSGVKP